MGFKVSVLAAGLLIAPLVWPMLSRAADNPPPANTGSKTDDTSKDTVATPSQPNAGNPVAAPNAAQTDANLRQPTAADPSKSDNMKQPPSQITHKPPTEVVLSAKPGTLHNPYTGNAEMIAEGRKVFTGAGCNGCHGGGGGGGICPSLKNEVWVYGSDDDTLFRLITLGSQGLQAQHYVRKGMENVVAPMPPFGGILKDDAEVFKVIAFIHSIYDGSKTRINW